MLGSYSPLTTHPATPAARPKPATASLLSILTVYSPLTPFTVDIVCCILVVFPAAALWTSTVCPASTPELSHSYPAVVQAVLSVYVVTATQSLTLGLLFLFQQTPSWFAIETSTSDAVGIPIRSHSPDVIVLQLAVAHLYTSPLELTDDSATHSPSEAVQAASVVMLGSYSPLTTHPATPSVVTHKSPRLPVGTTD